jgi:hypothetical protein
MSVDSEVESMCFSDGAGGDIVSGSNEAGQMEDCHIED